MKKLLLALGIVCMTTPAFGAGYGDAGCGLGSLLFGDKPGPIQILAATTNGSTYNQAFGITSGTSNCDAAGNISAERELGVFAQSNFTDLAKEMATGEGEYLVAFAGLLGCPVELQQQFSAMTQAQYATIFPDSEVTPDQLVSAVKTGIAGNPALSASCAN